MIQRMAMGLLAVATLALPALAQPAPARPTLLPTRDVAVTDSHPSRVHK